MIVLDTHVLVWFVQGDERIGVEARESIERAAAGAKVVVPAICSWEVAFIERKNGTSLQGGSLAWMNRVLALPNFVLAPLEPAIAVDSVRLDWSHKDPADRLIVATALHWQAPVLTADRQILGFAAAGHVEAIDARL